MEAGAARRFPTGFYLAALVVILVLALFPLASVFFAYFLADAHGCTLNEAAVHSCVVFGADLGGMLYAMSILGWLMLASIPFGAIALCLWFVVLVSHLAWRRTARKKDLTQ